MAKLIKDLSTATMTDRGLAFHRTSWYPLDGSSLFSALSDAQNYAKGLKVNDNQNGAVSYVGQQLYVVNSTLSSVQTYIIQDESGTLRSIGVLSASELCGISDYYKTNETSSSSEISSALSSLSSELTDYVDSIGVALVTKIDDKIFIKDPADSEFAEGKHSDLSIIKIGIEEYGEKISDPSHQLDSNILYILSSDYEDNFGQITKNLSTIGYGTSDAANMNVISSVSAYLSGVIDNKSNIYLSSISSDGSEIGGKLDKLNIVKFENLDTYTENLSRVTVSDLVLIEEDQLNAGNDRIISVATPEDPTDAANKAYVDSYLPKFSKLSTDHDISAFMNKVKTGDGLNEVEVILMANAFVSLLSNLIYK